MTSASVVGCTILAAALTLCACVAASISADVPRSVRAHPLPSYGTLEECLRLEPGDRVEFAFESTDPVDFHLRYLEGTTRVMPLVREQSRGDAGVFAAPFARDYCLTWEAGPAGALFDYRVRLRRAGS